MPLSKQEADMYYMYGYGQPRSYQHGYSQKQQSLGEVKRFRPKTRQKRKLNNRGKLALFILFAVFSITVVPFFVNKITKPVLLRYPANKNVKPENYNYLYAPTSKYIFNTDFMNRKMLVGVNKKPLMQSILLTDELKTLKSTLNAQIAANPKIDASIFVWDISNGKYVDIKGETPFPAASIIKIPVLISLFKTIEAGKFKKDDKISLEEYYRSEGSGSLQYKPEGYSLTIDDLARIMITESDNSSTNMLMSAIGSMTAINDDIKSWGLKNTHINNWLPDMNGTNYTTSKDLVTMLYNLDNEAFLNLDSRADIFDYLGHVKNNRLLAAGIPNDASIAHKTGDIGTMLGDAGIIYSPNGRKYIVAILVKRPYNDYSAKEFIVNASSTIYNYMTNY